MGYNYFLWLLLYCVCAGGMDRPVPKLTPKSSPRIQRIQGSPRVDSSPRQQKNKFPTLACLAARALAHETDLLAGDTIDLITPKDKICVREVILRELIKPHIFPLTIAESQNRESVHHNGVCGLDFIPTTNEVVSGACDGRIVFCNKDCLEKGRAYDFDPLAVSTLRIAGVQPLEIFIGSDGGTIYKMNYGTKKIESFFKAHVGTVSKICVGNSLIASCSIDKTVKVYDRKTLEELGVFKNFLQAVRCIELLEDESILISGSSDGKIKMLDVENKKVISELSFTGAPRIWGLGIMEDSKHIVAGFNSGRVSLIDAVKLQEISQWYGHGQTISALSCDDEEKYFATASWDNKARLWDVRMRACAATFTGHTDWVQQVKCLGNEVVTGSRDNMLRLWDIRKLKAIDAQELPKISALAQRLKNISQLKEPDQRVALLDELTKKP